MPAIVSVSWDGYVHYRVSNQIAQGDAIVTTGADAINYNMDGIYEVGLVPWGTSENDWDSNWRGVLTEEGMEKANEKFADLGDIIFDVRDNNLVWNDSTPGRVPNALGLMLGYALGAPYLLRLFLGRVTNLLFWVLVIWLAMRRLKSGERILCAVGLLPTLLFEACNYSYDPFCIGLIALGVASFVGELQRPDEPLTLGGALWILIPFFFGVLTKPTWVASGLMLLFMPKRKFRTTAGRVWWYLGCAAVACTVLWAFMGPFLSRGGQGYGDTRGESMGSGTVNVSSGSQLDYIAGHPVQFVLVMAGWFISYLNPLPFLSDLFVNFCYLPRPVLWPLLVAGEVCLLGAATLFDRGAADDGWPNKALRIAAVVGIVLGYLVSALAMYLSYTNVGSWYLLGMQVRYWLLFLAPLLLLVLNFGTKGHRWASQHVGRPVVRFAERHLGKLGQAVAAEENRGRLFVASYFWIQCILAWALILLGFLVRF